MRTLLLVLLIFSGVVAQGCVSAREAFNDSMRELPPVHATYRPSIDSTHNVSRPVPFAIEAARSGTPQVREQWESIVTASVAVICSGTPGAACNPPAIQIRFSSTAPRARLGNDPQLELYADGDRVPLRSVRLDSVRDSPLLKDRQGTPYQNESVTAQLSPDEFRRLAQADTIRGSLGPLELLSFRNERVAWQVFADSLAQWSQR